MPRISPIGRRIYELRTCRVPKVTQQQLAERAGVSVDVIQRLEQGRKQSARIPTLERIAHALDTDLATILTEHGGEVGTTDRRQVLAAAAGLAGAAMAGWPAQQVHDGPEELLRSVTGAYRRLEGTQPSRFLVGPVVACLELVHDVIRDSAPSAGRIYAVLSEVAGLAAWLYLDMHNVAEARRYYRVAVDAAGRSGHPLLPVYMQASLGQFAAEAGDTAHGLKLVRGARCRLPRTAPPVALVWLDAVEARTLAERRDREALALIGRSETRLAAGAGVEPVWPWVFRFDESKLAAYRAVCATRLGRTVEARAALATAAAVVTAPKQHAALQVEHARTLWADGDAEAACGLAADALDTAYMLESERVHHMVRSLRNAMGGRAGHVATVLDERLAAAYRVEP